MSELTSDLRTWLAAFWKRLACRHNWDPIYHSYHCEKCGAWSHD